MEMKDGRGEGGGKASSAMFSIWRFEKSSFLKQTGEGLRYICGFCRKIARNLRGQGERGGPLYQHFFFFSTIIAKTFSPSSITILLLCFEGVGGGISFFTH